ncbi:unnamed protein product [Amoebophrya sp. A120]|nr:unnamed protein product [Amoebophrya sp. A120]|eukprot:GSA120T00015064001.1
MYKNKLKQHDEQEARTHNNPIRQSDRIELAALPDFSHLQTLCSSHLVLHLDSNPLRMRIYFAIKRESGYKAFAQLCGVRCLLVLVSSKIGYLSLSP